jgi:hypothetical protein
MVHLSNLFSNPDMVVSMLVPKVQNESVSYQYKRELARDFAKKCNTPAEFVQLLNAELSHETGRARREILFDLKQKATHIFSLEDEEE